MERGGIEVVRQRISVTLPKDYGKEGKRGAGGE
jgi:hypothetical protein